MLKSDTRGAANKLQVDFRRARHQIEERREYSPTTRGRALSCYIGLFDMADENGALAVSTTQIATAFEIARDSWLVFREVLEAAGLLTLAPPRGGVLRRMQLVAPK